MSQNFWTAEKDAMLERFYLSGELSASQMAERINAVSRNAVIARGNRLRGIVFPSDVRRGAVSRLERERAQKEREQFVQNIFSGLRGVSDRNRMIRLAYRAGVLPSEIGARFQISRQRVFQIVWKEAA